MKHVKFTVKGRGRFPVDMLRYDCCYPHTTRDAVEMDERGPRSVTLMAARTASPTIGRWNSFGWDVVDEEVIR